MGKITAFVLAGGGDAGAYQAGALKAAEDLGIVPDFIFGTSAGALNATGYSYVGMAETLKMWRSIRGRSDVFGANLFRYLGLPFGVDGIYHSKPLHKIVEKIVLGNSPKVPVHVNVTDLNLGKLVRFHSGIKNQKEFVDWVVASASIPVLVEPMNERYVDGGVLENIPLKPVIELGAERIFMFLNFPHNRQNRIQPKKSVSGVLGIAKRSIELVCNEGYWEDFEVCQEMNNHPGKKKIEIHMVSPKRQILSGFDFEPAMMELGIQQGYREAKNFLSQVINQP